MLPLKGNTQGYGNLTEDLQLRIHCSTAEGYLCKSCPTNNPLRNAKGTNMELDGRCIRRSHKSCKRKVFITSEGEILQKAMINRGHLHEGGQERESGGGAGGGS